MAIYKLYRVAYEIRQPRQEQYTYVVSERVMAQNKREAVREGLNNPVILSHLLKHFTKIEAFEVEAYDKSDE